MNREEAINVIKGARQYLTVGNPIWNVKKVDEAMNMAIEALSSDAIAKAYNQGFVEGSVNATVNSNYVCPRCGEKMERKLAERWVYSRH